MLWRGDNDPVARPRMQLLILDGIRYRDAAEVRNVVASLLCRTPAGRRLAVRADAPDAAIQALNKRLKPSGNLKDARLSLSRAARPPGNCAFALRR